MAMNRPWLPLVLLSASLLSNCGQKASTRTTPVSPAPVVSGPLHPMHGQSESLANSPNALHCGSHAPVWANSHTKVYHVQGDPYYGRTKFGGYLCEQDAIREGYRAAKK
jgi:hypothetical protein